MAKRGNSRKNTKRRDRSRAQRVLATADGLLGKPRKPPENRHVLVALTLASLVAGIVFVVNCDRSTNAIAAAELGGDVSLHGWPLIYLERSYASLPAYLLATRSSDWPFPPVAGESRLMNYPNLLLDIICGMAIVLASYILVRSLVLRYDRWKQTWT